MAFQVIPAILVLAIPLMRERLESFFCGFELLWLDDTMLEQPLSSVPIRLFLPRL